MQYNFEKDEVETTAQVTEKRRKPEKMLVRSKDMRSILRTMQIPLKLSQVPELIEID